MNTKNTCPDRGWACDFCILLGSKKDKITAGVRVRIPSMIGEVETDNPGPARLGIRQPKASF